MLLNDICERIAKFKKSVDDICRKSVKCNEAYSLTEEYDDIITEIALNDSAPELVKQYILDPNSNSNIILPPEYDGLKSIFKLRKKVLKSVENQIKEDAKKDNYAHIVKNITEAVNIDVKNVTLCSKLEKIFYSAKLTSDLMEMYKMAFFYTLDSVYMEKLGDIHMSLDETDAALDYYLNRAELTENNSKIYKKMAKVFAKIGDEESEKTCLEQAKIIEGGNGI